MWQALLFCIHQGKKIDSCVKESDLSRLQEIGQLVWTPVSPNPRCWVYGNSIILSAKGRISKAVVWFLVIIGLLLFLLGLAFRATAVWIIGLLVIQAGLYLGMRPGGILRKDEVLDTWAILMASVRNRGESASQDTEAL